MLAQAGGELEALDAAEAEIKEDDRRSGPDGELESVLAGLGHQYASIGKQRREVLAKGLARVGVVLDDEDYAHRPKCTVPAVRNQVARRSRPARRPPARTAAGRCGAALPAPAPDVPSRSSRRPSL